MESVFDDRPMLMNVAYRLLGTVSEAEDAVQEAFARWYTMPDADRRDISSPTGWLVTVTTRICLDVLGSARARRETYVGEWLPEPVSSRTRWTSHVLDERAGDPADRVSLDESLNMALLVVLETMTPAERVAFTLHDVFGYSFIEVAEIVGRSAEACRRLASSARRRVHQARRGQATVEEHARVVLLFKTALETGDLRALVEVLDPGATAIPDGGGLAASAVTPLLGAETIGRYLLGLLHQRSDLTFEVTDVNGQAGLRGRDGDGRTVVVMAMAVSVGRIERIWAIRNPRKLTGWS